TCGAGAKFSLADEFGNVFRWSLREVRDTHDNTVTYCYDYVQDVGVPGGSPGSDLYLRSIRYTGQGSQMGPYEVRFTTVRESRPDVIIDARGGFKRVTTGLLTQID